MFPHCGKKPAVCGVFATFLHKIPLAFYASGISARIRAYGGGERSGTTRSRKQGGIKAALSAPGRLCDPILIRKMKNERGRAAVFPELRPHKARFFIRCGPCQGGKSGARPAAGS